MSAPLPRPFGPYALLSIVGRGGMGEVYLAKTGGLAGYEKHCVVKTLRPEVAEESEYVQRFSEEARVVVQLAHRNICSVFDVGRADGSLYVAMEHVAGRDLRQLARAGLLPPAVAVYIMTEVLEALDYAHRFVDGTTGEALSLVHRDVSPQNILLGVEGDVKLIDFGVATSTRLAPVTVAGTVLGKLSYMAPEHARGEAVDGRADQWSAAVVLVELLTGEGFYRAVERDVAWQHSGKGSYRPPGFASIELGMRAILERALSPSRNERYPSCTAFAQALVDWARANAALADCRDVRRLLTERFGDLAGEARAVYANFSDVAPPTLMQVQGPAAASPWESIATTMMIAPPTTGLEFPSTLPGTLVVRTATNPVRPPPHVRRVLASAALGALVALGAAAGIAQLRARPQDSPAARAGAEPTDGGVVVDSTDAGAALALALEDAGGAPTTASPLDDGEDLSANPALPQMASAAGADGGTGDGSAAVEPDAGDAAGAPARIRRTAPPVKQALRYDALARSNLSFLAASCVAKVPCAKNILDWAKRARLDAERSEVADAAASCARSCRLK